MRRSDALDFDVLIAIPYYEWNEVLGRKDKEEESVKRKVPKRRVRRGDV